jgi:hypothetical protein
MVSVSVGRCVRVEVGGGRVGVETTGWKAVAVGGGTSVAVGAASDWETAGWQAVSKSAISVSRWSNLRRGEGLMRRGFSNPNF